MSQTRSSKSEKVPSGIAVRLNRVKNHKPKTKAEVRAMLELASGKKKVITFKDGNQFKGMSADFAIVQGCADCHNKHPNATRKDFKKGDFMGAIIVRMDD